MIEIRIHGRGGQGGVTLAKLIATARFLQGDSVQAFGLYAAERSGAPLQAFCRYDAEPITNRNLIYEPDHVVVLDPTLVSPAVTSGLKPGGFVLLNVPEPPEDLATSFAGFHLVTVDATAIARDNDLGTKSVPIVNTALAGAAGKLLGFDLPSIHAALEHLGFTGGNVKAASRAYEELRPGKQLEGERPVGEMAPPPVPTTRVPGFLDGGGGEPPPIKTGQWAVQQPRRQQMTPPCNHVCPAGNDVQGFLRALADDDADEALAILLRTTPFPSVCGRVCPAPCMASCNRIALDGAVNVRELERFAGDRGTAVVVPEARRSERVAVVGSGPAGLAAAYHLGRLGYQVHVYEASDKVGGLLRAGIPIYRLPDEVLDREIDRILSLGVEIKTGQRINRAALLGMTRHHDAVLVATGLQELRDLRLGTADAEAVVQGIDFLAAADLGEATTAGEEIVVVGGGNTAVDAARTALRLGAESVRVVYRRTLAEMPAIQEEVVAAMEEGIRFDFLSLPVGFVSEPGSSRLICRQMELGEADESGRRRPVEVEDSDYEIPCDRLILALGQSPEVAVFPEGTEVREAEELLGLLETPVFAIGDLATQDGTVTAAIGSGRRAALHIHEVLAGEPVLETHIARTNVDVHHDQVIRGDAMKLHLFERQKRQEGEKIPARVRRTSFDEVHKGLVDTSEARRCLSCGVCNECDLCVTYCPEGVLKRVGNEFVFDYAYCKGCGICVTECPRNVVFMGHL